MWSADDQLGHSTILGSAERNAGLASVIVERRRNSLLKLSPQLAPFNHTRIEDRQMR
jgi:hypothetical protein